MAQRCNILAVASSPHGDDALMTACSDKLLFARLTALVKLAVHQHDFEIFDFLNIDVASFSVKLPNAGHLVT